MQSMTLQSLVPYRWLGASPTLVACGGREGRRSFGRWVYTLDGRCCVSVFAAPRCVFEVEGFVVELLECVEVHCSIKRVRVQLRPLGEQHC